MKKLITFLLFITVNSWAYTTTNSGNTYTRTYYTSDGASDGNYQGYEMSGILSTSKDIQTWESLEGKQTINVGIQDNGDSVINPSLGESNTRAIISFRCADIPVGSIITSYSLSITHLGGSVADGSEFRIYMSKRTWGNGQLARPSVLYSHSPYGTPLEWSTYNTIWTKPYVISPVDFYEPNDTIATGGASLSGFYEVLIPAKTSTRTSYYVTDTIDVDARWMKDRSGNLTGLLPVVSTGNPIDLTFMIAGFKSYTCTSPKMEISNIPPIANVTRAQLLKLQIVYNIGSNPTAVPTNTPAGGVTPTFTSIPPTSTWTATNTFTYTNTPVPTNTFTNTFTHTYTPTITNTPTWNPLVPTHTPTFTFTGTPPTSTKTFTNTFTKTFTKTFTHTFTNTATWTPSNTFTNTNTPTNTLSPTFTPSYTPAVTYTNTPVVVNTFTFTPTNTPTRTWTSNGATATKSGTPTFTFTDTRTFTNTNTRLASPSPTPTMANVLVAGGLGFPTSGAQGYIDTLKVKNLRYETLTQDAQPSTGMGMMNSLSLGNSVYLSDTGLELGTKSNLSEDNISLGDKAIVVDTVIDKIYFNNDISINADVNLSGGLNILGASSNLIAENGGYTPELSITNSGDGFNAVASFKWMDLLTMTIQDSTLLGNNPYIYFRSAVLIPQLNLTGDYYGTGLRYDGTNYETEMFSMTDVYDSSIGFNPGSMYIDLSTARSSGALSPPTTSSIKFNNSDALRYTDSTAVLDVYNGSASVFSVDADNGDMTSTGNMAETHSYNGGKYDWHMNTSTGANAYEGLWLSNENHILNCLQIHILGKGYGDLDGLYRGSAATIAAVSDVTKGLSIGCSSTNTNAKLRFYTGGNTTSYKSAEFDTSGNLTLSRGNFTMANGTTLTTETISPVDTSGIILNGATNKWTITNDGNLTLAGTATYWDDLFSGGLDIKLAGSADPTLTTFIGATKLYVFPDGASEKECFMTFQMPHKWKLGSTVSPHVHWAPSSTNTGVCRWAWEYSWVDNGTTYASTTTIYTGTAANGTAKKGQIDDTTDIVGSSVTSIGSTMVVRLYRNSNDAADTFTGDAFLLGADIHIECDSLGSNAEYTK